MKKMVVGFLMCVLIFGGAAGAHATAYNFEFKSGTLNLEIETGLQGLTLSTGPDLLIGYDSYPGLENQLNYEYSLTADLLLGYSVSTFIFSLSDTMAFNDSLSLGSAQGIALEDWISIGGTTTLSGSHLFDDTAAYGGYTLEGVILDYDLTIVDNPTDQELALNITEVSLSGAPLADILGAVIAELSGILTEGTPLAGTDLTPIVSQYGLSAGFSPEGTAMFNATILDDNKPVPVPAAIWLLGSGILGLAGLGRQRA